LGVEKLLPQAKNFYILNDRLVVGLDLGRKGPGTTLTGLSGLDKGKVKKINKSRLEAGGDAWYTKPRAITRVL